MTTFQDTPRIPISVYFITGAQLIVTIMLGVMLYMIHVIADPAATQTMAVVRFALGLAMIVFCGLQLCLLKRWAFWANLVIGPLVWTMAFFPLFRAWGFLVFSLVYIFYFFRPNIRALFKISLTMK